MYQKDVVDNYIISLRVVTCTGVKQSSRHVTASVANPSYCSLLHVNPRHVHSTFQPFSQLENLNNKPIINAQSRHVTAA